MWQVKFRQVTITPRSSPRHLVITFFLSNLQKDFPFSTPLPVHLFFLSVGQTSCFCIIMFVLCSGHFKTSIKIGTHPIECNLGHTWKGLMRWSSHSMDSHLYYKLTRWSSESMDSHAYKIINHFLQFHWCLKIWYQF